MTSPDPMNLQSLLASLESRFDETFPRWEDSQPNSGSHNLEIDRIKAFIKQSHEEIIQAVVEVINDKRPILWNDDPAKHNRNIGAYEALEDLKEALLSPKDT